MVVCVFLFEWGTARMPMHISIHIYPYSQNINIHMNNSYRCFLLVEEPVSIQQYQQAGAFFGGLACLPIPIHARLYF